MTRIDLNCDMGESFGAYRIGVDEEVIRHITSANIACGFHAGDPQVLNRTVKMAADHGVGVGAHPGFPDLMGFGRRALDCSLEEIRDYVVYQIGAIQAFCKVHGVRLQHVKPHGSLYNMSVHNEGIARAIAEAVSSVDPDLILVALAGKNAELLTRISRETGVKVAFEAFPDRAYTPEGVPASRKIPGAVIQDPVQVAERAVRMATEGRIVALDGSFIGIDAQTLCVHGDTPAAADLAGCVRESLKAKGVEVLSIGKILAS